MEWGLGPMLPVRKNLVQLGVIGYDQWQVTANQGPTASFPFYSIHAIGLQTNFISPGKGYAVFFKYLPEYLVKASTQGSNHCLRFPMDPAGSEAKSADALNNSSKEASLRSFCPLSLRRTSAARQEESAVARQLTVSFRNIFHALEPVCRRFSFL